MAAFRIVNQFGKPSLIAGNLRQFTRVKTSFNKKLSGRSGVRPYKVLLCQSIGFLVIIVVCLFDELLGLSSLVLGDHSYIVDLRSSTLKMLLILGVWLLVSGSTRRILAEARHLAEFMKVCAWCRRIEHEGHWMPIEKFVRLGFDKRTSHGICEDCLRKAQTDIAHAGAAMGEARTAEVAFTGGKGHEHGRSEQDGRGSRSVAGVV